MRIPVPKTLSYKDFQIETIHRCLDNEATLVCEDQGLGKTIEMAGLINTETIIDKILIVCPATLKLNWKRELEKWLIAKPTIEIVYGAKLKKANIIIINYDVMLRNIYALSQRKWNYIILDEGHYIKNRNSQRTLCCKSLEAKKRIALTGTPITNRPIDIWSLLDFLEPGEWMSYWNFAKRYCGAYMSSTGWDVSGISNPKELQTKLYEKLAIRHTKREVLKELKGKQHQIIVIEPNSKIKKLLKAERAYMDRVGINPDLSNMDSSEYRNSIKKLKGGKFKSDEHIATIRRELGLAKVPFIIAHLKDCLEYGKVVCFCSHTEVAKTIHESFKNSVMLIGSTTQNKRQQAIDDFQTKASANLFIGNTIAAGVGITLTASHHVVFAEYEWTPSRMAQAEDRLDRIGQTEIVTVQHLVVEGSLDYYMAKSVVKKQEDIDSIMEIDKENKTN